MKSSNRKNETLYKRYKNKLNHIKALLQQAGRGSKRRQGQRSNLSSTKRLKLCSHITVPRHTKWITEDESSHDDESSYDEESDSETPQTSDDIY